jgi:hypothetical protein
MNEPRRERGCLAPLALLVRGCSTPGFKCTEDSRHLDAASSTSNPPILLALKGTSVVSYLLCISVDDDQCADV